MNTSRFTAASINVATIAIVESPLRSVAGQFDYASESRVRLFKELQPGLIGIEYFSHLWVIYHQHHSLEWLREKGWGEVPPLTLPPSDDRSGQGIFSSRAPCRPAALGSCIVELVRRENETLVVRGLDAIDGTPVLDVKPYVPQFDAFPQAVIPLRWARVMDRHHDETHGSREFHWDTTNAEFALGLRAGVIALGSLVAQRSDVLRAEIEGSVFFAQGWEAATGCSPLRGTLVFTERVSEQAPWRVQLTAIGREVSYLLPTTEWPDAAAVMSAPEGALLQYYALTLSKNGP